MKKIDETNQIKINKLAWAYLITFRAYNSWSHGDKRTSVDSKNNVVGKPRIAPNAALHRAMKSSALESELILNAAQRETVLKSIIDTCQYNHWTLFAAHVRTNHIHIVLQSNKSAEQTMGKIKCYATRDLKKHHVELSTRNAFWGYHGSTDNIWGPEELFQRLYYTVVEQGKPMALWYDKKVYDAYDIELYKAYFDR